MFIELDKLVTDDTPIKLSITRGAGNILKVCVMPTANAKNAALAQPLALSATAADLDAGFVEVLSIYIGNRNSLADQVAATAAILGEAAKAQSGKAVKALKSGSKPASNSEDDNVDDSSDDQGTGTSASAPVSVSSKPAPTADDDLLSLLEED